MEVIQSYLEHNGLSFLIPSITWPGKAATIIGMTSTKGTTILASWSAIHRWSSKLADEHDESTMELPLSSGFLYS